jgi:hypothetical protein
VAGSEATVRPSRVYAACAPLPACSFYESGAIAKVLHKRVKV